MSPTKTIINKALNLTQQSWIRALDSKFKICSKKLTNFRICYKVLKPAERCIVIEALVNSLDNPDPVIDKAWAIEAEKRLKAYKAGKLKTVSFEAMFPKHS